MSSSGIPRTNGEKGRPTKELYNVVLAAATRNRMNMLTFDCMVITILHQCVDRWHGQITIQGNKGWNMFLEMLNDLEIQ
jgi:hypothetical protein